MFDTGQKVAHFEILRKLGEGGMGEVYLVQDTKLNRKAAMKVQHLDSFEDKERRERFIREAQTAAQISHPNIMAIFDMGIAKSGEGRDISYIVMEYLPGKSLSDIMRNAEYDLGDMMRVAEKIASGLAAAHRMNIVHRDIKADNIIIDENGDPKILDFGLAKAGQSPIIEPDKRSAKTVSQELTSAGKILGTVSYMSPEQARGEKVDIRSDVFSFGILLYKMVTGEFPFDGPTQVSTLAKILEAQPAPPHLKNENIPPELERIIDKCLQKEASERYQGASDLAVDLRHVRKQFDSGVTETISGIDGLGGRKSGRIAKASEPKAILSKAKLGIAAAAVLVIAVIGYFGNGMFSGSTGTGAVQAQTNSLAILGFDNKTGDESFDWLRTGLPEILLTDLAQTPSIKVISHERILDCFADRKEVHTHEESIRAAKSLGASKLLSGAFYRLGDQIRIDARLEDVATGEIILTEKVIGPDAFSLVDSLTMKLASSLDIKNLESMGNVRLYTSSSEEAYKHYLKGLEKFLEQRWDEARESFNKALEIDSTFALPYMRIGMSYIFDGRLQQGLPYLQMAEKFENKLPQRDRNLLDIYSDIWLQREFNDAFTKLEVFVKNFPDDKEGRCIYGILIYQFQQDTTRAYAQIDTALQLDPLYLLAHMFSIAISGPSGNIEKTVRTAEEIKKFYPESPLAYEELADAYKLQGEYDKSISEYKQLYSHFPSNKSALRTISDLFIIKRQFDSANYYLAKNLEVIGDDPVERRRYYNDLANLHVWQGQFKKAVAQLKMAVDYSLRAVDSVQVQLGYQMLTRHFDRMGKKDSAVYYLEQSWKWSTSFSKLSYPFMLLDLDYSRRDEARTELKKILPELRPKLPKELMSIIDNADFMMEGMYEADTAKIIEAARKLRKQEGNPKNSQGTFELAELLILSKQYEEGKELMLNFVQGNDQSNEGYVYLLAHYYLGLSNEGLNKKKDAVKNYNEVLRYWGNSDIENKYIKDTRERLAKLTA